MHSDPISWKQDGPRTKSREGEASSSSSQHSEHHKNGKLVIGDNINDEEFRGRPTSKHRSHSISTIGSLRSPSPRSPPKKRHTARSGSISENVIDVNGVRKIVLETTSSSDSEERGPVVVSVDGHADDRFTSDADTAASSTTATKKKRKKRGKKKKGGAAAGKNSGGDEGEEEPLLS